VKRWGVVLALAVSLAASASTFHRPIRAGDGVTLALYRYANRSARPAVLLVPGLGMNRHVFDLEGVGLAPYLQAHGRDVFVLEPRGVGASGAHGHWHLAAWVEEDLPAAVASIQRTHPGPVDLVAVGFGGTLALASTAKELAGKVHRVIALSTPALPELPNAILETVLEHHGPLAELWVEPTRARAFEMLYAHRSRFPFASVNTLGAVAFDDLGEPASGEWLRWMKTGDLQLAGGETVSQRLARYALPTLLFLPQGDNVAHPEFAAPLRTVAPRAAVRLYLLNRVEGMAEDDSHLAMLLGTNAPREVFAPLLRFLDEPEVGQ